jgi:hypothetical protein
LHSRAFEILGIVFRVILDIFRGLDISTNNG